MTQLKIKQAGVPGRGDQGAQEMMYVSQKVERKWHIIVPCQSIHIDEEQLKALISEMFPVQGKHGGTF